MIALAFAVVCCNERTHAPRGIMDSDSNSDTDVDTDVDSDSDTEPDNGCGSDAGDGEILTAAASWEFPAFTTGSPSIFTDVYVSPEPRLYFVNSDQQCEIALVGNAPDFGSGAGSFCALTPGYELRGWARHGGVDHIADAVSHSIVSGTGGDTYPMPSDLLDPAGLASDGIRFWIPDNATNTLRGILPSGDTPSTLGGPGSNVTSVSFDGQHLWVLTGSTVVEITLQGTTCRTLQLDTTLAGFSIQPSTGQAWGVALSTNTVYRFSLPPS